MRNIYNACVKALTASFGKDKVRVCSAHHIQVTSPKGPHNVWPKGGGGIRLQLAGNRRSKEYRRLKQVIEAIKNYTPDQSEQVQMERVVELSAVVSRATDLKKDCIYADAGFKNQVGKYAIVLVMGDRVLAESNTFLATDPLMAEKVAIGKAVLMRNRECTSLPIYSDCKVAVEQSDHKNLHWISRDNNPSDQIGNLRGVDVDPEDVSDLPDPF